MPFLPVLLGMQDVSRCSWSAAGLVFESPSTLEVHDDGLVMPARCESLIAIKNWDSHSVMRCHRDVQLREWDHTSGLAAVHPH